MNLLERQNMKHQFEYEVSLRLSGSQKIVKAQMRYLDAIFQYIASTVVISNSSLASLRRETSPEESINHYRSHFYRINENSLNTMLVGGIEIAKSFRLIIKEYIDAFSRNAGWFSIIRSLFTAFSYFLFVFMMYCDNIPGSRVIPFFAVMTYKDMNDLIDLYLEFNNIYIADYSSEEKIEAGDYNSYFVEDDDDTQEQKKKKTKTILGKMDQDRLSQDIDHSPLSRSGSGAFQNDLPKKNIKASHKGITITLNRPKDRRKTIQKECNTLKRKETKSKTSVDKVKKRYKNLNSKKRSTSSSLFGVKPGSLRVLARKSHFRKEIYSPNVLNEPIGNARAEHLKTQDQSRVRILDHSINMNQSLEASKMIRRPDITKDQHSFLQLRMEDKIDHMKSDSKSPFLSQIVLLTLLLTFSGALFYLFRIADEYFFSSSSRMMDHIQTLGETCVTTKATFNSLYELLTVENSDLYHHCKQFRKIRVFEF